LVNYATSQKCILDASKALHDLSDEQARLVRITELMNISSGVMVRCYSLGHDAIGLALQRWKATYEATRARHRAEEAAYLARIARREAEREAKVSKVLSYTTSPFAILGILVVLTGNLATVWQFFAAPWNIFEAIFMWLREALEDFAGWAASVLQSIF
jgi:hypothetical protein